MNKKISFWQLDKLSSDQQEQLLQRTESDLSNYMTQVQPIIEQVRQQGDVALVEFARRFDDAHITADQLRLMHQSLTPPVRRSMSKP